LLLVFAVTYLDEFSVQFVIGPNLG